MQADTNASSPPVDHAPPVAAAPTAAAAAANASAGPIVPMDSASPLAEKHEKSSGGAVEAKALVSRGDAIFGTGDLTTARAFYRRGADVGDGTAAPRLGETFDPAFLQEAGLGRVAGDLRQALYWYRQAHDLGNRDADVVLKSIDPRR
jgi:TPR repeat protein